MKKVQDNSSSSVSFNSIAAQLVAKGFGMIKGDDEGGLVTTTDVVITDRKSVVNKLGDLMEEKDLFPKAVTKVFSKEPEWLTVIAPNDQEFIVPIFNKTASTKVTEGIAVREVQLPPYVGHIENGRFEQAKKSLYKEMIFQARTELSLRVGGFTAPVAVSMEIPAGYYKLLRDSKGKVCRILVNENEMKLQAVDSDGDRATVGSDTRRAGQRACFMKIPFTSQAPVLQLWDKPVFEDFVDLTMEDLPSLSTTGTAHLPMYYTNLSEAELPLEIQIEFKGRIQSTKDHFIKSHTPAPVGVITTEWNALESKYFRENDYTEAIKLAFATQVPIKDAKGKEILANGRYEDVEGNGLKQSRKDGATKKEFCYSSFKYLKYGAVSKSLLSSASGIQRLLPAQLYGFQKMAPEEIIRRYWEVKLSDKPDVYGNADLVKPRVTIQEKVAMIVKSVGLVKATEQIRKTVKQESAYSHRMYAEVLRLGKHFELAEQMEARADAIVERQREAGWTLRDGGLISRLIQQKLLVIEDLGHHHSGLGIYRIQLNDPTGKPVALFDQKREANDLPERGLGYYYLLVPVFDATLDRWVDGITALKHAFRQEVRTVLQEDPDTGETVEVEEVRSFDRYNFLVRNPETGQIVRGLGVNKKDWDNGMMMNQLQEALTGYCGKMGILVNTDSNREDIMLHNFRAAQCVVGIRFGRYEQTPEKMYDIFVNACNQLKDFRPKGSISPGNKQQNMLMRKYVLARDNGTPVWASEFTHVARSAKSRAQLERAMLPVKARIALVDSTTKTGGWASTQGVEAQSNVQCFYPQVIQDQQQAEAYCKSNDMEFSELESKIVNTWLGTQKQIWLTPAKEQIELGKFIDAKYGIKFMPAPLGGTVVDEDGKDIHFVKPVWEVIDKAALHAILANGVEEKIIEVTEVQDGVVKVTRVKALVFETTIYRSGSHSENTPAKRGFSSIGGFDRFAVINTLIELGWQIPTPHLTNTQVIQGYIADFQKQVANS